MQFLWNLTDRIDYWFRTKLGINAKQKAIELAQDANPTIKNNKKINKALGVIAGNNEPKPARVSNKE